MKKLLAIVAVLMLLVALVGVDKIGDMLRMLIRDDRDPRATRSEEIAHEPSEPKSSRNDLTGARTIDTKVESESFHGDRTGTVVGNGSVAGGASGLIELSITGDVSPFHFIRSSEVLGTTEPTEQQRELLQTATEAVLAPLDPGVLIFDADVTSQFGAPVLVFAREELELTRHVKAVYETLMREPVQFLETANVEQD